MFGFGHDKELELKKGNYPFGEVGKVIYSIGNRKAVIHFKGLNTGDVDVFVCRDFNDKRKSYIYTPFPFKIFQKYYEDNKDSKYWDKKKHQALKYFIEKKEYYNGTCICKIITRRKMYYLRTYEDINYYRLHRNPDSNYTIGKLYSVVDDSLAIQELLLNFMKANRPFKEKVKSFVQNHPMLVNVSIRIGAAIVFAGISELLLDALDSAGVDPSLWFIPDGDTGDSPLLTEDGFEGIDASVGDSDVNVNSSIDIPEAEGITVPSTIDGTPFTGRQKLPIAGGGLQTITVDDIGVPPNHSTPHVLYKGVWHKIINNTVTLDGHTWKVT